MAAGGELSVLRLVDRPAANGGATDERLVTVSWQAPGFAQRSATVRVAVSIEDELAELVRWYLEEYGKFPSDPAPALAVRAEATLADLGRRLFRAVFGADGAATIWGQATVGGLDGVRVEVDTDPSDVPGLPWELLREPANDRALVLATGQFVRTHHETAAPVMLPDPARGRLRVLLVISRPDRGQDVPFRSVASRLVRGGADALDRLELDVLRPATFARLERVLRAANDEGQPYHVVHFDGHGTYLDATRLGNSGADPDGDDAGGLDVSDLLYGVSLAGQRRSGRHGYLLFEDPETGSNQQLVDGPTLAGLLVRNRVPVLVLNACRSAYTEPQDTPDEDAAPREKSVHGRIRAYGSLAAEVADSGVAGVVAMRYNVYVVTAAQYVADLYAQLGAGKTLGQAATVARQQLSSNPARHIGATPIALQDWVVPTIYESAPLTLLAPPSSDGVDAPPRRIPPTGAVPPPPDVGFFGRDETLLALDRSFDTSRVILLHALAGAGKSTTVAEFARWYAFTGGLDHPTLGAGPVLWTSFEHHTPLDRVLDAVGAEFGDLLQANGIHWAALTDPARRREEALGVLADVPVLWVWDNVEPVGGFPEGTPSDWTADEQAELLAFLRDVRTRTRAKILLTSRRDEQRWLGLLPTRVQLPPMRMGERRQLARAIADQLGHPDAATVDWRPLLRFTGGNPLTITVAVRQALRENAAASPEDLAAFVERVSAGRSRLEDAEDAALGRSVSLAASLDYGFTTAFTDRDRAVLAVLHLFRDTVDVDALRIMGEREVTGDDAVPPLAGITRETGIALLDRAVDIGLLTAYGSGHYGIHPALPWYFHALYTQHVGPADSPPAMSAERAYTETFGSFGRYYFEQVEDGNTGVLTSLRVEEENLRHAVELAGRHRLPNAKLSALQGLYQLYFHTGRSTEWARLVEQSLPDYVTPNGRPRPGRENAYNVVTTWQVRIASGRRDLATAARLQTGLVGWSRERAEPHLNTPAGDLDPPSRILVRNLAVAEMGLGQILLQRSEPAASMPHFQAHYDLVKRIGDTAGQSVAASNLGDAYQDVGDLDQAEHWYQRGLDVTPAEDRLGRAAIHGSLANLAYERLQAGLAVGTPEDKLLEYLNKAISGLRRVLNLLPADHHEYRAVAHNQLGAIYHGVGDASQALFHYQQSIQHKEVRGDTYGAARSRYNIALLLSGGRRDDALHYARAALANYLSLGPGAAADVRRTEELIRYLTG